MKSTKPEKRGQKRVVFVVFFCFAVSCCVVWVIFFALYLVFGVGLSFWTRFLYEINKTRKEGSKEGCFCCFFLFYYFSTWLFIGREARRSALRISPRASATRSSKDPVKRPQPQDGLPPKTSLLRLRFHRARVRVGVSWFWIQPQFQSSAIRLSTAK